MAKNNDLEQLIVGCKSGDGQCFSQLIDKYANRCYGYFYRLTGNRDISDDLLSELFLKLVNKIHSYKGGSFDSWLFKIASNIFQDYLRSKLHRKKILEIRKERFEVKQRNSGQQNNELFDKLQVKLSQLDSDTRQLILLRFYSQLSFKEIAKMRSEPIGTTLSKLHRGLKRLKQLME